MPDKEEKRINPLFKNTARTHQPNRDDEPEVPPLATTTVNPVNTEQPPEKLREQEYLLSSQVRRREIREVPFEEAYKRETLYLDRELKRRFDILVKSRRTSKTELINEALLDLLRKYDA